MALPYFKFYASDFLTDPSQVALTPAQCGAYIRILAMMWNRSMDKGEFVGLPYEEKFLAAVAGTSVASWLKMEPALFESADPVLTTDQLGQVINNRLLREFNRASRRSATNSANGAKGAKSRWGKMANAKRKDGHIRHQTLDVTNTGADAPEPRETTDAQTLTNLVIELGCHGVTFSDYGKQCKHAQSLLKRKDLEWWSQAAKGMKALFPHSNGEPWDVFDLGRKGSKAFAAVTPHKHTPQRLCEGAECDAQATMMDRWCESCYTQET